MAIRLATISTMNIPKITDNNSKTGIAKNSL